VDDRTVHEIYTAAFGTVVADSQPSSVMCSYSYINGTAACENSYLDEILKDDFGFTGFITSDWGGTHSTVASANAGMDMDMPGDDGYFDTALKTAVTDGQVPQSRLDDMVTRILREEFRFGLFDHPSPNTPDADASTPAHVTAADQISEDGTVLLKNSGNILPLSPSVKSIAVIGDGAGTDTMSAGGGSATVAGTGTVTPFDGIKARAGSGVDVEYAQGDLSSNGSLPAIDTQYFTPPSGTGNGLQAQYYDNMTLSGTPVATQTDPNVDYDWTSAPVAGLGTTGYSVKFTGTITPPATGTYTFGLTSDDGSRLFINGQQVIDNWRDQAANTETAQVSLTAGQPAQIEVDYYQDGGDASVNLGWQTPNDDLLTQATTLAAKSDVAIVYANDFESEGSDLQDIDLPGEQNQMISAVAKANPNTIVVLNTGSAVTMPWLDQVKGVFEAWYPGQQAGNSIAALLYGDVDPSGKLPVTFPTSLSQVPASTAAQWPGVNGTVDYSEGLDVGYRWYTAKDLQPLYPFGYGLSYTDFTFSGLHVDGNTLTQNGKIQVTAEVKNTGKRAGDEVAQLYLTDAPAAGEPPLQLKGFQKVSLKPGQSTRVHFTLDAQDASYWNTDAQAWTLTPGTYTVHVGDSSESLPLTGTFKVTHTDGPRYTAVTAPSTVTPGETITVKTTFTNGSTDPVLLAKTALSVPSGWTATAAGPALFPLVRSGGTATTTWKVTVPAGAGGGSQQLSATTAYLGSKGLPPGTGSATVGVAFPSLTAAFDTVGVTDDTDPTAGNLDGSGFSFSAEALASVGVTPGGAVGGYTWPDIAAGKPDVVTTDGQVVVQGGSGSNLSFLAVGTNGTQSGTVTVTYTDGTTSSGTITAADWYNNAAVAGCTLVVTSPYWNIPANTTEPAIHPVSLYSTSVPLTAGKTVAYVTLPTNSHLHIFATSVK
jgi:beta-glucosidase